MRLKFDFSFKSCYNKMGFYIYKKIKFAAQWNLTQLDAAAIPRENLTPGRSSSCFEI
jgi:hypothetical protein